VLAATGDVEKAVRAGESRWYGYRAERVVLGVLGAVAALALPGLGWIAVGFGLIHAAPMFVVGWKDARSAPRRFRQAAAFAARHLIAPLGILSLYAAPALAMSFVQDSLLDLPIDHAILLAGIALISASLLWLVARYHGRHDRSVFASARMRAA